MLVGSNDRAIDIVYGPVDLALGIGLLLHGLKETLPDTRFAPAIETTGHRAPRTIAFRQIAPRGTGAQHPQDAVEDASMIQSGSTRLRFLRWKQRLEPLPLGVGEFFAFHTGECTPPARVCKHALVLGRRDAIRKEFFETPDMVCELGCHRRGSLLPCAPQRGVWNGDAQRLMRAYDIEDRILKGEMAP